MPEKPGRDEYQMGERLEELREGFREITERLDRIQDCRIFEIKETP